MKNEKIVFWQDSFNLEKLQSNITRVLPIIQGIVDEFKKVKIEISSIDEITKLLDTSRALVPGKLEDLVFDLKYPEIPNGFNRDTFRQFAEMPDMEALIESFEPLQGYQNAPGWKDLVFWYVYELNGSTVEINQDKFKKLAAVYFETVDTPEEKERFEAVKDLCVVLDRLAEMAAPGQYFNIPGVVQFNDQLKKYEPGQAFVKYGTASENILLGSRPQPDMKSKPLAGPVASGADDDESISAANAAKARNQK